MSEGLIGVLIGSLIALFSSVIPIYVKINHEKSKRNYEKKVEIYIQALDIIGKYSAEIPRHINDSYPINPELMKETNRMYSLMMFYSTSEIHKKFTYLVANILESKLSTEKYSDKEMLRKIDNFKDLLKSDLGKKK